MAKEEKKTDFFGDSFHNRWSDLSSLLVLEHHSPVDIALCSYMQPLGTDNHLGPSDTEGNEPVRTRNLLLCGRRISLPSFKKTHGFDSIYIFSLSFMITANQQAQTHFSSLI